MGARWRKAEEEIRVPEEEEVKEVEGAIGVEVICLLRCERRERERGRGRGCAQAGQCSGGRLGRLRRQRSKSSPKGVKTSVYL